MQADDVQTSDSVTQGAINNAAISVEVAASAVISAASETVATLTNIETAASDTAQAFKGIEQASSAALAELNEIEKAASDVAKAEASQAADISAARLAEVRAQVQRDNAVLKAGQYIKL